MSRNNTPKTTTKIIARAAVDGVSGGVHGLGHALRSPTIPDGPLLDGHFRRSLQNGGVGLPAHTLTGVVAALQIVTKDVVDDAMITTHRLTHHGDHPHPGEVLSVEVAVLTLEIVVVVVDAGEAFPLLPASAGAGVGVGVVP